MSESECEFSVLIGGVEIDGILIGGEAPVGVILRLVKGGKVTQWPSLPVRPRATKGEIDAVCHLWLAWVRLTQPECECVPVQDKLYTLLTEVNKKRAHAALKRAEVKAAREATSHARQVATANADVADARTALAAAQARLAKAEAEANKVNGSGK